MSRTSTSPIDGIIERSIKNAKQMAASFADGNHYFTEFDFGRCIYQEIAAELPHVDDPDERHLGRLHAEHSSQKRAVIMAAYTLLAEATAYPPYQEDRFGQYPGGPGTLTPEQLNEFRRNHHNVVEAVRDIVFAVVKPYVINGIAEELLYNRERYLRATLAEVHNRAVALRDYEQSSLIKFPLDTIGLTPSIVTHEFFDSVPSVYHLVDFLLRHADKSKRGDGWSGIRHGSRLWYYRYSGIREGRYAHLLAAVARAEGTLPQDAIEEIKQRLRQGLGVDDESLSLRKLVDRLVVVEAEFWDGREWLKLATKYYQQAHGRDEPPKYAIEGAVRVRAKAAAARPAEADAEISRESFGISHDNESMERLIDALVFSPAMPSPLDEAIPERKPRTVNVDMFETLGSPEKELERLLEPQLEGEVTTSFGPQIPYAEMGVPESPRGA